MLFGTATHSLTFTAQKSDLMNISKSTSSSNKGSTFTLEKLIFALSVKNPLLSFAAASSAAPDFPAFLSDERVHKLFLKYIHCCSQMFKCFLFFLLCRLCIDIHSGLDILMPHDRLDNLQVGFSFTKPCTECVSQTVR